jgi:hypothetical protein
MRGPLVDLLRYRVLGTSGSVHCRDLAPKIRRAQSRVERSLMKHNIISPTPDDILSTPEHLIERFRGSYAVIHLAALPQP